MPVIETIGAAAESLNLLVEVGRAIRAAIGLRFSKDGFRTLSTLSTLEFKYEQGDQIAHYVQDRTIVFTKTGTLPPFIFATEGRDYIDELLIDNEPVEFERIESFGEPTRVVPKDRVEYPKGHQLNAALLARSINGFTKPNEKYSLRVARWVGESSVAIIYPASKKPAVYGLFYREAGDRPEVKRHAGHQGCGLKKTTCDRWILGWKLDNAKPGRTYTLEWTWS